VIKLSGVLILLLISAAANPQNARNDSTHPDVVVIIDFVKQKQVIRINGEETPHKGILFKLSEIRTKASNSAKSIPAVVLAHERTSVYDLLSMKVALMKAGFGPVRYFSYDEHRSSMFELTFAPPIPFNSSGPLTPTTLRR
jgi:hypothetical protein